MSMVRHNLELQCRYDIYKYMCKMFFATVFPVCVVLTAFLFHLLASVIHGFLYTPLCIWPFDHSSSTHLPQSTLVQVPGPTAV